MTTRCSRHWPTRGGGSFSIGKVGRQKHHFLNPVPIRLIHDRWISKYAEAQVSALTDLKSSLEKKHHD